MMEYYENFCIFLRSDVQIHYKKRVGVKSQQLNLKCREREQYQIV